MCLAAFGFHVYTALCRRYTAFYYLKFVDDVGLFQNDINTIASAVHNLGLQFWTDSNLLRVSSYIVNASKTKLVVISRKRYPPYRK